ncbi:MAG: hypothetical protein WC623_24465 [Pedobacter sp.]|uniref:hypothetical protein n=1 Tax=Pedobacter sp. TaxID=1411316 RepID=UPI003561BE4C
MRDLKLSDKNKIGIFDARSGTDIELYYRTPTTSEEVEYQHLLVKRQGRKVIINPFEARLEMGLRILTGFSEGSFGIDGKAISSEPENPNYKENWKDLLKETASDIITTFAFTIFEGARIDTGTDFEIEEKDDVPPFQKKSKG